MKTIAALFIFILLSTLSLSVSAREPAVDPFIEIESKNASDVPPAHFDAYNFGPSSVPGEASSGLPIAWGLFLLFSLPAATWFIISRRRSSDVVETQTPANVVPFRPRTNGSDSTTNHSGDDHGKKAA